MKHIYLVLWWLLLLSHATYSQSAFVFLGKTIGEAKVMAIRSGLKLEGDENVGPNGIINLGMKGGKTPPKMVDLGMNYVLMFDSKDKDICVQAVGFPSVNDKWVIDTIAARLEHWFGFRPYNQTTWYRRNPDCQAQLEYVRALTADGRKTNLDLLRLTFTFIKE